MKAQIKWLNNKGELPPAVIYDEILASTVCASGSSVTSDIVYLNRSGYNAVLASVRVLFPGGAAKDATVDVLASVNGSDYDTQKFDQITITRNAGATEQASIQLAGMPFAKVRVNNPAGTGAITAEILASGRKWEV
jgi:hypothetical protein